MSNQYRLGFIGAGNMAEAIVKAAIEANVLAPEQIVAADPSEARREVFASLGIATADENTQVIAQSEQLVLAVKPQKMETPAAQIGQHGPADQIVISIMAGIGTDKLTQAIGADRRIVRVMPNTPVMVGCGMAGLALGRHAQPGDEALTRQLFEAGGEAVLVDEAKLDAITAISGSGPAYVFYLAEAMEQAAQSLGLGDEAKKLVAQTIRGGAALLAQSDDDATTLKEKVMSPGGTTEAAIHHLDDQQANQAIVQAIHAAEARSRELGA
jgi:pyrroline-5-carboxylate reductase